MLGAALLTGCNDEPTARFELEKQGLSVIKACDIDLAIGCNNTAIMEKGIGIAKNPERAVESYGRACKLGLEEACKKATP